MMEKTIFSKKHVIIKLSLVLLLVLFAFSFAIVQAVNLPALAEDGDVAIDLEAEYGFDVNMGNYTQGTFLRVKNLDQYPVFTLTFNSKSNVEDKRFWYGVADIDNIDKVDVWTLVSAYEISAQGEGVGKIQTDVLARDEANANGGIYKKYVFFRGGNQEQTEFYYSDIRVDLRLDNNASDDIYKIDSLSAKVGETVYDLTNPKWTSSPITLTVTNNEGEFDNTNFYYQLTNAKGETSEPVMFKKMAVTEEGSATSKYYGQAIIPDPESGITSFNGEITVYSTSFATPNIRVNYDKELKLYYDGQEPQFSVDGYVAGELYAEGSWAKGDVTYVVNNVTVASGARYFCDVYVSGGQTETYEIQRVGEQYSYTVSNEGITNVKFYAVSGSGVEYEIPQKTARIDKVRPSLKVSATDKYGAEIRSMGTAPGDYRVGYAKDEITFVLTNDSVQQQGNTITYWYSFDGENYQELNSTSNNYQLTDSNTANEKVINKTYYFKVTSATGEKDESTFTVSVLDSNYEVKMIVPEVAPNTSAWADGWLKEQVAVYFTLPSILGVDNEYEIRGMVTGAPDTIKVLGATVVTGPEAEEALKDELVDDVTIEELLAGKVMYKVYVDTNLNNSSYTFEIYDKAQNKGGCVYASDGTILEETFFRTTQLKLDLTNPTASITRHVNGTTIELASDDSWSAGEVLITINPASLISGVRCYPYIDGLLSNVPMEARNGAFTKVVSVGGLYEFDLVSGSGRRGKISCQVNVDTRTIDFQDIIVSTIDETGKVIEDNVDVTDPSLEIANDIKVSFVTNHNYLPDGKTLKPHFNFYYAEFEGDEPTIELSRYTLYVPGEGEDPFAFIIKLPEEGGNGYKKYSFFLTSMAVDTNGHVSQTALKYFSVKYDIRDFAIDVNYSILGTETQWTVTAPQFSLSLLTEGVNVKEYQYRLEGSNEWITIPGLANNKVDFEFEGVEQKVPGVDDLRSMDEDNTFSSYSGIIYFRALNSAGHASPTKQYEVNMDTSTPNPLYAVRQKAGENVYDEVNRMYTIYSNQNVEYVQTGASTSPIFLQKAPITYYYRAIGPSESIKNGESKVEQLYDSSVWTKLTGDVTFLSGTQGYYWLVAENGMRTSSPYKIHVMVETSAPTAILQGGTIGSQEGVYEYNWTQDRAEIQFKITSQSAVYIWYSLDGSDWEKVEDKSISVNGTTYWSVAFVAPPTDGSEIEEEFVIVGNLKKTARFKITNLSGSECIIDDSVIIRIDNESPEFKVDLSTASSPVSEDELLKYFSETIHIQITPVAYNPGGVEYTYKVDGTNNFEKMAGAYITTDEIIGYDGNGVLNLIIRAQARASLKTYEKRLTIKIDKVAPDFKLVGEVYKGGKSTDKIISSAEWVSAEMVKISRVVDYVPVSGVEYTVSSTQDPVKNWNDGSPIEVKEISVVYVTATSGSGLVVSKEFYVNIDNQAPIIHAGPIVNNDKDPNNPYHYYIDQEITYTEAYLKSAMYNGFPLSNGHIIATHTVDNSNKGPDGKTGGYVHIVVEDLAGNKAELKFYMTVFELTVNNIEINDDHIALLTQFEASYEDALNKGSLTESRAQYFKTLISRLWDRLATLEKEVADYQAYLALIEARTTFDLISDYPEMEKYIAYFISPDPLIVYPKWQQEKIKEGVYESYYSKLLSEYNNLDQYMSVVRDLQKQVVALPATNIVEESDYQEVIRVYNAYQSLSNDQKAVFKSTLYTKLIELKRKCEVYLLQDEDTGISIDGDHLVGESVGVMLEVVNYAESTELFINAQKTLYETVSEGNPRKIISINKLGLTGYGSQYDTGEITITLPIPSEEGETDYTQYVYFAVYRLSADGTLSPVKDVMRARDGKSVYFTSTQLDTYVLATTANVVVREEPDKIYGSVAGIEIDATLLTYITFAVIAMFVVFVVIILLVALRRRKFLRAYNRDHKNALQRRGITRIPKGNAPPPSNPARPEERVGDTKAVYYYGKRRKR